MACHIVFHELKVTIPCSITFTSLLFHDTGASVLKGTQEFLQTGFPQNTLEAQIIMGTTTDLTWILEPL